MLLFFAFGVVLSLCRGLQVCLDSTFRGTFIRQSKETLKVPESSRNPIAVEFSYLFSVKRCFLDDLGCCSTTAVLQPNALGMSQVCRYHEHCTSLCLFASGTQVVCLNATTSGMYLWCVYPRQFLPDPVFNPPEESGGIGKSIPVTTTVSSKFCQSRTQSYPNVSAETKRLLNPFIRDCAPPLIILKSF